jgi:PKD repeat protein
MQKRNESAKLMLRTVLRVFVSLLTILPRHVFKNKSFTNSIFQFMHFRLLALLCFSLLYLPVSAQKYQEMIDAGTYTLAEIQQEAEAHFDLVGRGRGTGHKQYKRWEYVAQMELDETGVKIPNVELARRARDYRKFASKQQTESGNFGGDWKQLGPTYHNATSGWNPGVGRITSIGIDESNTNHLIVGSPTGGVWKTLDAGDTWVNITDDFTTVDVYSLEISPYNNAQYLWGSTSGRIYRSTDAGATWNTTNNLGGNGRVSRIQYHPTDPNIVYAVSESNGLYRSTNSGANWTAVSGVSGVVGYDVEFKPGDPNTIYFSGRAVYRSTNGGSSFTQITGFGTADNNYKMMGVSPANPNFVYVLESNGGRFGAFYKSTNSGSSFAKLIDGNDINFFGYSATGDDDRGQAPRDMDVAVSPFNANEVHIAGIHTWKSTNGGTSFNLTSHWVPSTAASLGVGYNHADIDILKFVGNTLYVGSDGGIYISNNGAASFIDRTSGLGIREFYKIGVSKTNPNVVSGGSQDNGTSVMRGNNRAWVDWLGADGMETFVDWNNANILYGTSQYGSMYRSTNQGNSRSSISKPPDVEDGAWVTPFEQDPQVANTIYVAFEDVWKSTNSGGSWTKISDFANGNMNQMKLAPSNNQRIYVSRGSNLYTTANGGTSWVTTPKSWGTSSISYIAVHPQNPERVLIVTGSNVYHSTNAGNNWTTISAGLPSGTKYCATWENTGKNGIYVGGFGFVSYTNDDLGGQWVGFFTGLPNVRVYELEINYISNTIFAGTYGRGLWESPLYQLQAPVAAFIANQRQGCREMTVTFTDQSVNNPKSWEWTFEGGDPATSNLQSPTVTFSGSGTYTVRLKSSNDAGENTVEALDYITLFDPPVPVVADVERCAEGEFTFQATAQAGEEIKWYADETATTLLSTGSEFTTSLTQTTTFYASAATDYLRTQQVGPSTNLIGNGGDHAGNYYLIFDAYRPFRLKSALVYAVGAKDRIFQLRDANETVLLEKTIFVPDGESRVILDMDIPQGTNLQIGCGNSTNFYRNNSGVNYPYILDGLMTIKNSTAGLDYYYYLYDLEIESNEVCESPRVAVSGVVNTIPEAAVLTAASTTLCTGGSLQINAENVCVGCTVHWSNGETGAEILVTTAGTYTAVVRNATSSLCGDSPVSNTVEVTISALPEVPTLVASGNTALCFGESVLLSAENVCAGCTLNWSNGETGSSIEITTEGSFVASTQNICGESPASAAIEVTVGATPEAPVLTAIGSTSLCPGESLVLTAENVCANCTVQWSNGETGPSITAMAAGTYTASVNNGLSALCSDSPASNAITISENTVPDAPILTSTSATICTGETVLLSAENVCADCTVLWSNGETGPSIEVATVGVYSATLGNVCGNGAASADLSITAGIAPEPTTISTTGNTALCPGESLELVADAICAGCIVTWSNGETGPNISVSAAGLYTATLSNACGESTASNEISVTLGTAPDAASISAAGSTTLCVGETVVLMAENVCAECTVTWSNGETGLSITVAAEGLYTATLSNVCGNGPVSNSIEVNTETVPNAPTITAAGATVLCPGTSVVLTAENVCPDCTVTWSNGETGLSITAAAAGIYTAIVSNPFNQVCGASTGSNAIELSILPPFVPEILLSNDCVMSAPAGSNYQWSVDGMPIPDATGQMWSAQVTGNYTVSMNSPAGCLGSSVPSFVEACSSINTTEVSGLQVLRVYPNPAQDRVYLDMQVLQTTRAQLDLYAADGRYIGRLFQGDILAGGQVLELELPVLPAGMYQYRLTTASGSLHGNLAVQQR